jgi:hypothetical protein
MDVATTSYFGARRIMADCGTLVPRQMFGNQCKNANYGDSKYNYASFFNTPLSSSTAAADF